LNALWPYTGEMFADDRRRRGGGVGRARTAALVAARRVERIDRGRARRGDADAAEGWVDAIRRRRGRHSEHLGHLLATMQFLPRAYPGARW
jgi:ring-1,2-phenylacetyl-CoA epoxidase subunit PaaC